MRMKRNILCFLGFAALWCLGVDVTFFGGAGEVGGSCALVENESGKMLVDCGTIYADEAGPRTGKKDDGFGFSPREVDAVLITHAHADHAGRVPQLVRSGFRGKIYMTEPTRQLLDIAWGSQAQYDDSYARDWQWSLRAKQGTNHWHKVHWRKECKWRQKISQKNRQEFKGTYQGLKEKGFKFSGCTECAALDVEDTMKYVKTVPYDTELPLNGLKVVFRPVEHLPGSAAIYFYGDGTSFAFSGDLGTRRSRLSNPIRPSSKVDAIFVECTYGDKSKGDADDVTKEYARFSRLLADALTKGKLVWIPAFAMDRTQRVILEVLRCKVQPNALYTLSPSGNAMTDLYFQNPEWFPAEMKAKWESFAAAAKVRKRRFDPRRTSRKSAVLVTTSGMMDAGFSYEFLKDLLPDTNVVVCLVGYQAPGTPGWQLRSGERSVVLADGETKIPVGAAVESFECFSGHGDARENEMWLGENLKSRIYLIHGELEAMKERKAGLEKRHGADVVIAKKRECYHLGARKGTRKPSGSTK